MRYKVRYHILTIVFFSMISVSFAVESSLNPHTGTGQNILLSFWETNGSDILRIYQLPCDITDSGIECEPIRESRRIYEMDISGDGSLSVDIAGDEGLYRICVKLKESNRQDCDKDNYYMLYDEGCVTYQVFEEIVEQVFEISEEISIDLVSIPSILFTNTSFISCVNITNNADSKNITTYSYVYSGSNCVSGSWTDNSMEVSLNENFTHICYENFIEPDTDPGEYKFKARAKWNGTNYDSQHFSIEIKREEFFDLKLKNISDLGNGTLIFSVSNKGNIPTNITILIDSYDWFFNESFKIQNNSFENISIQIDDYNEKISIYLISEDVIFAHNVIREDTPEIESVSFEGIKEQTIDLTEETYLYGLLSLFTLIALIALVVNFTR